MNSAVFFLNYFTWHYGRAFMDITHVWANFFWFLAHFFSISLLLRTLFSPFKRIHEESHRKGLEDFAATFIFNVLSRIIGMIARLFIILLGLFSLLVWILVFIVLIVFWIVAPAALIFIFVQGLVILFS